MKTIHKYGLEIGHNSLALPEGAQVLTVQEQGGRVQMWALVNPEVTRNVARVFRVYGTGGKMPMWALVNPEVTRNVARVFRVYGTGGKMPMNPGVYIATVQLG